jgi:SAM-dependent methyltransferase
MKRAALDRDSIHTVNKGAPADLALFCDLRLQCPRCTTHLDDLECPTCGFQARIENGIVHAMPPERVAHYAQFVTDYENVRAAEGRGSQGKEYYLELPYKDATGKNDQQWKIRSRSFDYLARHILKPVETHKRVLDLGAGNCWMSYRLALAGHEPVAVDLLTNENDGLGAAVHFDRHLPNFFPRFRAEAIHLPFEDEQFDAVIFNASFHYSENYEATLQEALRCLRNGGCVIISDTPWYSREESGREMVAERRAAFRQRFGTASDSMNSLEYLTDERLGRLEEKLLIQWAIFSPWYGWKWAMRPWIAKYKRRRQPSRFRIYVARKHE